MLQNLLSVSNSLPVIDISRYAKETYANTLARRGRVVSRVGIESSRLLVPQHLPRRSH